MPHGLLADSVDHTSLADYVAFRWVLITALLRYGLMVGKRGAGAGATATVSRGAPRFLTAELIHIARTLYTVI